MILFADLALAQRLEAADSTASMECARALARLHPEESATVKRVAGGYAVYAGVESPMTQTMGLGLNGPVTAAELDKVEEFYRSRGAPVNIELCPFADASLIGLLGERGYRLEEPTNKLFQPLSSSEINIEPVAGVNVREVTLADADLYARTIFKGFFETEEDLPPMLDLFKSSFHVPASRCFLAEIDGQPAGGGLVIIVQGVAALSGTSALPVWRKRGVHKSLIQARLAFAVTQGCDLAMMSAQPGSTSQRNVERQGFRVAYTRSKMVKRWA